MFVTLRHFDGNNSVEVDHAVLRDVAVEAGTTAAALDQLLRELLEDLGPMAQGWRGEAGREFQRAQGVIERQLERLNGALHWLSDQVDVSSRDYANVDEELRDAMAEAGAEDDSIERLLT